jgi:endonuclease/exonuclease/phosphatase (EEP) superfamily protein YafD
MAAQRRATQIIRLCRSLSYSLFKRIVVFCLTLWAVSDTLLSLDNSWLLFLYRAAAPALLICLLVLAAALGIGRVIRGPLPSGIFEMWLIALFISALPICYAFKFLPTYRLKIDQLEQSFTLLNLNSLGFRDLSAKIISEIERHDPDIVTLQEVNPELAKGIEDRLSAKYQCRILQPAYGSRGMGTLAKNPCVERSLSAPGVWVGSPIVTDITLFDTETVTVANFHAIHPHAGPAYLYESIRDGDYSRALGALSRPIKEREDSINLLLTAVGDTSSRKVIMAGDLNASMRNNVYEQILQKGFKDSWLDLRSPATGGTWPAPAFLGGLGIGWLLRIDFIFRSQNLSTMEIDTLPDYLDSDHRGMLVRFGVVG